MTPVHVTVVEGPADVPPAVFLHGVLSWGSDDDYGFGHQRPLTERRRLLLVDRRGFGASPDLDGPHRSDHEVDAEDTVALLDGGAHLVGHSYGAVAAMLAAAARPDLVRSLCLIQPGALRPAEDGLPAPEPTPARLRAARTTMAERPCWDADVPLEPLAEAPWPALVIRGDWSGAPEEYRRLAGVPLQAAAEVIADRIGSPLLTAPGYYPHVQQSAAVNAALAVLWDRADNA
ncbi:alpha/beta hydrolase [Actinosynnema sp. NPDC023794]